MFSLSTLNILNLQTSLIMKQISYQIIAGVLIIPAVILTCEECASYFNLLLGLVFVILAVMVLLIGKLKAKE